MAKSASKRNKRIRKNIEESDESEIDEAWEMECTDKEKCATQSTKKNTKINRKRSFRSNTKFSDDDNDETHKIKCKQNARKRRQQKRDQMTEQERQDFLRKQREQKRKNRQELPQEIKKQRQQLERDKMRLKRSLLTPEQKREQSQKRVMRRLIQLSEMTEEEKKQRQANNYMSYVASQANLSPDEIERRKLRQKERHKFRKATMTDEQRARIRKQQKKWRHNLTGEKREKFLEGLRRRYRYRMTKLKKDPKKYAEERMKQNKNKLARLKEQSNFTKDGKPRRTRTPKELLPPPLPNETPEQKEARLKDNKKTCQKRLLLKKKMEIQNMLDRGLCMEEIQCKMVPAEKREQRLLKMRLNKAKVTLSKKLILTGASSEEIQEKIIQLEKNFTTSKTFKPYKPRPDNWKPIDSHDLLLLEESKTELYQSKLVAPIDDSASVTPVTSPTVSAPMTPDAATSSCSSNWSTEQSFHACPPPHIWQNTSNYQYHPQSQPVTLKQVQCQSYEPKRNVPGFSFQNLFDTINSLQDGGAPVHEEVNHSLELSQPEYNCENHFPQLNSTDPVSSPKTLLHQQCSPTKVDPILCKSRRQGSKRTVQPTSRRGATGPQKAKMNIFREAVCEECGNSYTSNYIKLHMLQVHNPNWVNGKCRICSKSFTNGRQFWQHYSTEHVDKQIQESTVVCDLCGAGFRNLGGLKQHMIYLHGEGQKEENFKKCPFCPKAYKRNITLNWHLRRVHHDTQILKFGCMRCDKMFATDALLSQHVKEDHPNCYFVCEYCHILKYSECGLQFHYNRCPKIPKGALKEKREKTKMKPLERRQLPCEFCGSMIQTFSLQRHYLKIHGIKEDRFRCLKCEKTYGRREFWAVHMEMEHGFSFDELSQQVRKLNKMDMTGVVVLNPSGLSKGKKSMSNQVLVTETKSTRGKTKKCDDKLSLFMTNEKQEDDNKLISKSKKLELTLNRRENNACNDEDEVKKSKRNAENSWNHEEYWMIKDETSKGYNDEDFMGNESQEKCKQDKEREIMSVNTRSFKCRQTRKVCYKESEDEDNMQPNLNSFSQLQPVEFLEVKQEMYYDNDIYEDCEEKKFVPEEFETN